MAIKKKIRLFKPSIGNEEISNIKRFQSSWLGYGRKIKNLKTNFQSLLLNSLSVNSGTAALHLALLSQGLKKEKRF